MVPTFTPFEDDLEKAKRLVVGEEYRFDYLRPHSFHGTVVSVNIALKPPTITVKVNEPSLSDHGTVVPITWNGGLKRWQATISGNRGVCFFNI